MHQANRLRLASRAVFWAFPLFLFFQWAVIIDQVDAPWDLLRDTNTVVAAAYRLRNVSLLISLVTVIGMALLVGISWVREASSLGRRLARALSLVSFPLLGAASVLAHAWGLRGPPWDQVLFPVALLGALASPIGVGYILMRHDPGERVARASLLAALVVTLGMVLSLGGLLACQVVTSVVWPESSWSGQLLLGLGLVALPTVAATRAVLHGIGALAAS